MNELQQTSANFTGLVSFMITSSDELFQWPEALVRDIELHYRTTVQDCVGNTPIGTDEEEVLCPSSSSAVSSMRFYYSTFRFRYLVSRKIAFVKCGFSLHLLDSFEDDFD